MSMEELSFLKSEAAREGLDLKEYANGLLSDSEEVENGALSSIEKLIESGRKKMGEMLKNSANKTRKAFEVFVMATALSGCAAPQAEINSAIDRYSDKDSDSENEEENEFPLTLHINDSDLRDSIVSALQEAGHMSDEEARRSRTERLGMESGLNLMVTGDEDEVAEIVAQELQEYDDQN